ncbi:AraC family ligand binding domain-containing protein [Nocardia sp. NPDC002869]|uniref:AraC family ligand binding domain-containing protein n=1 Tax=Nocardia sp. NPDC002869 TaxID=3161032 RepID=UPI00398CD253
MVRAEFWRSDALPFLESRRACPTVSCYKPHSHDAVSIGAVDEGRSVFTGAPEGPVQLTAKNLVVIPAYRVHACNPVEGRWSYQMLHVDEAWLAGSLPELGVGADRPVRVIDEPGRYAAFCHLNEVLFSAVDLREKKELLVTVLDEILTAPAQSSPAPESVRRTWPSSPRSSSTSAPPTCRSPSAIWSRTRV